MLSRRSFLDYSAKAGMGFLLKPDMNDLFRMYSTGYHIHIFSKHLQWLSLDELPLKIARMGFNGVDLTVRPGGHIMPEKVESQLPHAVDLLRREGLEVEMITTQIKSIQSSFAEYILKTASGLGIKYYRMGWVDYDPNLSIEENWSVFRDQFKSLCQMNAFYGINASYQNHSGDHLGSDIWDLYLLLKDLDSPYIGVQYDLRHAMVEGLKSWRIAFEMIAPYINTIAVKDYDYTNTKKHVAHVPLSEGIVPWQEFFQLLKDKNMNVPISLHCEYPQGGAEKGNRRIEISKEKILNATQRDLTILKSYMN